MKFIFVFAAVVAVAVAQGGLGGILGGLGGLLGGLGLNGLLNNSNCDGISTSFIAMHCEHLIHIKLYSV